MLTVSRDSIQTETILAPSVSKLLLQTVTIETNAMPFKVTVSYYKSHIGPLNPQCFFPLLVPLDV